jgi:4-carboxymuconolactone decarboxylase
MLAAACNRKPLRESVERLTRKPYTEMSVAQKPVFDEITEGWTGVTDGRIGGLFDIWMRNPGIAGLICKLGKKFRFNLSIDRRYIEISIIVTGAYWKSQYEWYAHERMARDIRVLEAMIQSIKGGDRPNFDNARDAAAHDLAVELHRMHEVNGDTYASAVATFGDQGVAKLINLCGFYTMVSM